MAGPEVRVTVAVWVALPTSQVIFTWSPGLCWCSTSPRELGESMVDESTAVMIEPSVMPARSAGEPETTATTSAPAPLWLSRTDTPRYPTGPMKTPLPAWPARMRLAISSALLDGIAKATVVLLLRKPWASPAVMMPTTWPALLTRAPPESPGLISASDWIMPVSCSAWAPPSLAVIDWSSAVTLPSVTRGAPPRPSALPRAKMVSPIFTLDESPKVTVGSPDTLWMWITAMSSAGSTPTTSDDIAVKV